MKINVKNKLKSIHMIGLLSAIMLTQNTLLGINNTDTTHPISIIGTTDAALNMANTNIILNLTGKLIKLHFHSNISHYADVFTPLRPLMLGGAPITGLQALTTKMLPQPVNMHKMTCHSVTASIGNTKKSKADKIEPCTMKIPDLETFNDYKLTIEKNTDGKSRLIFTKCDSIRMIPLKKDARQQDISRANSNTYVAKKTSDNVTPIQNNVNSNSINPVKTTSTIINAQPINNSTPSNIANASQSHIITTQPIKSTTVAITANANSTNANNNTSENDNSDSDFSN